MKNRTLSPLLLAAAVVGVALVSLSAKSKINPGPKTGAIRVLFLGHENQHHNSNKFYPMLAKGLGREAIYFDHVTSVEEAFVRPSPSSFSPRSRRNTSAAAGSFLEWLGRGALSTLPSFFAKYHTL